MKTTQFFTSVLVIAALILSIVPTPAKAAIVCPDVMSHRGNAYWNSPIENSMDAFRAGYDGGATWIETDMRFTQDDVPVLMHDEDVSRTTNGSGLVQNMTASQFNSLTMSDGVQKPAIAERFINARLV